jgi:hypothetical protein
LYIDVAKVDRDAAGYVSYVSSVNPKCFICFKRMLQAIYLDVEKVDLNVVYTCMLQVYVLSVFRYFIRMFASVLSGCCICL